MNTKTIHLELGKEKLVDIDCPVEDIYVGITNKDTIITPNHKFKLSRRFKTPIIRQLNNETFLVANSRIKKNIDNCFIFDYSGNLKSQFYAGDGIMDIEVISGKIVISYFDEGVSAGLPGEDGLAIFDANGRNLWGYNNNGSHSILDCYCICEHRGSSIVLFPYPDFPLIELDLNTFTEKTYPVPEILRGSKSICSINESLIFYSPNRQDKQVFKWSIGAESVEKLGEIETVTRGMRKGRFISVDHSSFTITNFL